MIRCHNYARRFEQLKSGYFSSLEQIHKNEEVVNGYYTKSIEDKIRQLTGKKHAMLVRSGAQSLRMSLLSIGIRPGDEVIITNYSCPASLAFVTIVNAVPVLCEIDQYAQMDCSYLEGLVTNKTKAVVATGLYGDSHDHDGIKSFCEKYDLYYINDAAQSYFAEYNGVECSSLGDIVCMSFADNKQVPIPGTHGAIASDYDWVCEKVLNYRRGGKSEKHLPIASTGETGRPDEDKAAQIYVAWQFAPQWQQRKLEIGKFYREFFDRKGFPYRQSPEYSTWNAHKFSIFCDDKFEMQKKLLTNNIESELHYPDNFTNVEYLNKPYQHMKWTDYFVKHALSIPINAHMTDAEVETVAETVCKIA